MSLLGSLEQGEEGNEGAVELGGSQTRASVATAGEWPPTAGKISTV